MPSYVESDDIKVIVDNNPTMLKPILFTSYDVVTKYDLHIIYEDSTTKDVELVQKDKTRPYKIIYKKDGKLLSVIGIPTIYEVKECNNFCDFVNRTLDSNDLLFEMDCSSQFQCTKVAFYLKDIRDIIDLAVEGIEDPGDNMEVYPITSYPMYLNNQTCVEPIHCVVDEEFKVTLESTITKLGQPLTEDQYTGFGVVRINSPVRIDRNVPPEINKIPLIFTENSLGKEIRMVLRYFVKEIDHPIFEEFKIIAHKVDDTETVNNSIKRLAVTTQDTQYLGDGLQPALGGDLTPGFKEYRYKKKK